MSASRGARLALWGAGVLWIVLAALAFHRPASTALPRGVVADEAARGASLWRRHGCADCHVLGADGGRLGPDLTGVVTRRGVRHVRATLEQARRCLTSPDLPPGEILELLRHVERFERRRAGGDDVGDA